MLGCIGTAQLIFLSNRYSEFGEKEKAVKCYTHFIEAKGADAEVDPELAEALLYVGVYYSSLHEETATAYCQRCPFLL